MNLASLGWGPGDGEQQVVGRFLRLVEPTTLASGGGLVRFGSIGWAKDFKELWAWFEYSTP